MRVEVILALQNKNCLIMQILNIKSFSRLILFRSEDLSTINIVQRCKSLLNIITLFDWYYYLYFVSLIIRMIIPR